MARGSEQEESWRTLRVYSPGLRPERRRLSWRWSLWLLPVAFAGGIAMANPVTERLVLRADAKVARDVTTGVILGAEARDLGPPDAAACVIFVHGFVGSGNNFSDLPEKLAARRHVRVLRLPGHGTTPLDLEDMTNERLLDEVLTEVGTQRQRHRYVVLVGHSMGGALASIAASKIPVDGLVLAAPYFGVTHRWYYGLKPERWASLTAPVLHWTYKSNAFIQINDRERMDEIMSYRWIPAQAVTNLMALGTEAKADASLAAIKAPVLLLHARGDVAASPESAEAAFQRIGAADKKFVWLEKSNHHIFFDFDRDEVFREIEDFVVRVEVG